MAYIIQLQKRLHSAYEIVDNVYKTDDIGNYRLRRKRFVVYYTELIMNGGRTKSELLIRVFK